MAAGQLEHLVDVVVVLPAAAMAVVAPVDGRDVQAGAREDVAQLAGLGLVGDGMDAEPGGNPFFQQHIAPLEDQPQLLAVHAAGLGEAVIEVDQDAVAVADRTLDLVLEAGAGPGGRLGGDDLSRSEPAGEQVEEMDAVLDEDAAALRAGPRTSAAARAPRRPRSSRNSRARGAPSVWRSISALTASNSGL